MDLWKEKNTTLWNSTRTAKGAWNALSLSHKIFGGNASLIFPTQCSAGYLPGGGIRGGAVLTVGGGGRKGGGGRWVGGAPGGKNGGGLVKLSTSGLDRSERTCKNIKL